MTREHLAQIKAKPHGPDVALLIQNLEDAWEVIASIAEQDAYCPHCGFEITHVERLRSAGIPHSTIDDSSGTC